MGFHLFFSFINLANFYLIELLVNRYIYSISSDHLLKIRLAEDTLAAWLRQVTRTSGLGNGLAKIYSLLNKAFKTGFN
jgi:hypothetical protein